MFLQCYYSLAQSNPAQTLNFYFVIFSIQFQTDYNLTIKNIKSKDVKFLFINYEISLRIFHKSHQIVFNFYFMKTPWYRNNFIQFNEDKQVGVMISNRNQNLIPKSQNNHANNNQTNSQIKNDTKLSNRIFLISNPNLNLLTYYIPVCLNLNLKNIISMDLSEQLTGKVKVQIKISIFYGGLDINLVRFLKQNIELEIFKTAKLKLKENQYEITFIENNTKSRTFNYLIRKIVNTELFIEGAWSPFQIVKHILTIHFPKCYYRNPNLFRNLNQTKTILFEFNLMEQAESEINSVQESKSNQKQSMISSKKLRMQNKINIERVKGFGMYKFTPKLFKIYLSTSFNLPFLAQQQSFWDKICNCFNETSDTNNNDVHPGQSSGSLDQIKNIQRDNHKSRLKQNNTQLSLNQKIQPYQNFQYQFTGNYESQEEFQQKQQFLMMQKRLYIQSNLDRNVQLNQSQSKGYKISKTKITPSQNINYRKGTQQIKEKTLQATCIQSRMYFQFPTTSYIHFVLPMYKRPLNNLLKAFFPIFLLGIINIGIIFQHRSERGKAVLNIASLMVSFVALLSTIKQQIGVYKIGLTFMEVLVFLQALTIIVTLIHIVYDPKEVSYNGDEIFSNVYGLLVIILSCIVLISIMIVSFLHICYWKRQLYFNKSDDYLNSNERNIDLNSNGNRFARKDKQDKCLNWTNSYIDRLIFNKLYQFNQLQHQYSQQQNNIEIYISNYLGKHAQSKQIYVQKVSNLKQKQIEAIEVHNNRNNNNIFNQTSINLKQQQNQNQQLHNQLKIQQTPKSQQSKQNQFRFNYLQSEQQQQNSSIDQNKSISNSSTKRNNNIKNAISSKNHNHNQYQQQKHQQYA